MQTLPLAIWGLRPTEGTPEQPIQVDAGFTGILEEAMPLDEPTAVEILGEDWLEAGSNGPNALDQELDQANSSEVESDLLALMMSFVRPESRGQNPDAGSSDFGLILTPSPLNARPEPAQASREMAHRERLPDQAEAQGENRTSSSQDLLAKKAAGSLTSPSREGLESEQGEELTTETDLEIFVPSESTPAPSPAQALKPDSPAAEPKVTRFNDGEAPTLSHSDQEEASQTSEDPAKTRSVQPHQHTQQTAVEASVVEDLEKLTGQGTPEMPPTGAPLPSTGDSAVSVAKCDHEVEESVSLTNPRFDVPAAPQSVPRTRNLTQALQQESDPAVEAPQAEKGRTKLDLPAFVHQSDPVSQMLTERWVAWVKQNFGGPDAPKSGGQPALFLPTSPNNAFEVVIQEGQVHMNLNKPISEPVMAAVLAGPSLISVSPEVKTEISEDALHLPPAVQRTPQPARPIAEKPAASKKADQTNEDFLDSFATQDQDAEAVESAAPLARMGNAQQEAPESQKPRLAVSTRHEKEQPAAQGNEALQLDSAKPALTVKAHLVAKQGENADEVRANPDSPEPAELKQVEAAEPAPSLTQTFCSQKVNAPVVSLSPERREAAVSQAKEVLVSQTLQPRGQVTTIRLNPDDLGALTVTVKQSGRRVTAEISASLETVRQALETQKQELVQAVEAKGSQLNHLTIRSEPMTETSQHGQPQHSQAGQHRDGQGQREAQQDAYRSSRLTASHNSDSATPTASTQPIRARRTSRFDLTA